MCKKKKSKEKKEREVKWSQQRKLTIIRIFNILCFFQLIILERATRLVRRILYHFRFKRAVFLLIFHVFYYSLYVFKLRFIIKCHILHLGIVNSKLINLQDEIKQRIYNHSIDNILVAQLKQQWKSNTL
jgi:hypothetical protein